MITHLCTSDTTGRSKKASNTSRWLCIACVLRKGDLQHNRRIMCPKLEENIWRFPAWFTNAMYRGSVDVLSPQGNCWLGAASNLMNV